MVASSAVYSASSPFEGQEYMIGAPLERLAAQSHATTVHLIAHSMGNRALTRALYAIAEKHAGVPPMFQHVFLAAPDIDVGVFRQLAATFPSGGE